MHIQRARCSRREQPNTTVQVPSQTLLVTISDVQATMLLSQRTDGAIMGNRWNNKIVHYHAHN